METAKKESAVEYGRTSAATTAKISERVKNEPARNVYCDMVLDDSIDAPRNLKQVNKYLILK